MLDWGRVRLSLCLSILRLAAPARAHAAEDFWGVDKAIPG